MFLIQQSTRTLEKDKQLLKKGKERVRIIEKAETDSFKDKKGKNFQAEKAQSSLIDTRDTNFEPKKNRNKLVRG